MVLPQLQSKARQKVSVLGSEFFRWHRKDILTPRSDGHWPDGHWPVGHDLFGAVNEGGITNLVFLLGSRCGTISCICWSKLSSCLES